MGNISCRKVGRICIDRETVSMKVEYSKNPLNRTSKGPDKMSSLERIPVYRGFSHLPIHRW